MRTTLVLDDHLVAAAKGRATKAGMTLSDFVNHALRATLASRETKAPRFEMVTYGRRSKRVHHEPAELAAVLDDEDRAAFGH